MAFLYSTPLNVEKGTQAGYDTETIFGRLQDGLRNKSLKALALMRSPTDPFAYERIGLFSMDLKRFDQAQLEMLKEAVEVREIRIV